MIVFEPVKAFVVYYGLDDVCPVVLANDFEEFVAVVLPRKGGNGQNALFFIKIHLQATILTNENEVVESVNVKFFKLLVEVFAGLFNAFGVEDYDGRSLGLVFQKIDFSVQKRDVGDVSVSGGAVKVAVSRNAHFLKVITHLTHPETDVDGIALQLLWREAHHRVLIADAGIIQVDGLRAVEKRQFVMPFGIGTGAILRIHDADVHVLHAKVAVDGGLGLGEKRRSKE